LSFGKLAWRSSDLGVTVSCRVLVTHRDTDRRVAEAVHNLGQGGARRGG
jgi:hypothetical protein